MGRPKIPRHWRSPSWWKRASQKELLAVYRRHGFLAPNGTAIPWRAKDAVFCSVRGWLFRGPVRLMRHACGPRARKTCVDPRRWRSRTMQWYFAVGVYRKIIRFDDMSKMPATWSLDALRRACHTNVRTYLNGEQVSLALAAGMPEAIDAIITRYPEYARYALQFRVQLPEMDGPQKVRVMEFCKGYDKALYNEIAADVDLLDMMHGE